MDVNQQHRQIFLILCLFSCMKLFYSSNVVINDRNCMTNNSVFVNKSSPSINFSSSISATLLRSSCLIHIQYTDFQPILKYNATVKLIGNKTLYGMIVVHVFAGHPNLSKPVETFYAPNKEWSGHLPSSDMYIKFVSLVKTEFTISISVKECLKNCYELNMHSIIPTTIVELPSQCSTTHCLDNYAVSYVIRASSQLHIEPCNLYFPVTSNPTICITVSSYCCGDANNCHIATISVDHAVYFTLDREILRPWCLPWTISGRTLTFNWKNKGVIEHTVCTVTIYTNTSNHGKCSLTTTTVSSNSVGKEHNSVLIATVAVAVVAILVLSTIIVGYFIISNRRQTAESGQIVNYFHHQSSVQGRRLVSRCRIVTPPPYSIAVRDSPLTNSNHTNNNPAESGYVSEVSSTRSDPSENIMRNNGNSNPCLGAPPPYSVSSYDNTTSEEI
ncbi:uncharacterized protein LOC127729922 isoform X2 [Mytilus californianus]|uniref:uncharacterized protein LOC127729922 isoform X2 n=1 Tax=Mytilus californianus TaxID=6549 RepID=UPI0022470A17|nr:uncharacterized protein LOC127729922 isoform X2 [Mytilus californianus]